MYEHAGVSEQEMNPPYAKWLAFQVRGKL